VIVDEAARANPLDLSIPMSRAERRIILVGDHRQLPHILEADVERQLEQSGKQSQDILRKSLFYRLFRSLKELEAKDGVKRTITLDAQYRMHPVLGKFVSDTFYKPYGEGFDSPRPTSDFVHDLEQYQDKVAVWKNISGQREAGKQSKQRRVEAKWIAEEAKRLMELRPDFSFGIITFYAAQVQVIFKELEHIEIAGQSDEGGYRILDKWRETEGTHKERLRVGTVDAFQGKEFDVVFLSMVRSNDFQCKDEKSWRRKYGYLIHENRLCVALSRQQRLIILAGDVNMLHNNVAENAIPGLVKFRKLCEGEHGLCI
jgi:superfamily I DNA and/or RNA helicase